MRSDSDDIKRINLVFNLMQVCTGLSRYTMQNKLFYLVGLKNVLISFPAGLEAEPFALTASASNFNNDASSKHKYSTTARAFYLRLKCLILAMTLKKAYPILWINYGWQSGLLYKLALQSIYFFEIKHSLSCSYCCYTACRSKVRKKKS